MFLESVEEKKNKGYFAVMLVDNDASCYAVGMGKSHFYLKEFAVHDFGVSLAERIANKNDVSLKHSRLFGGRKNKSTTSYQPGSEVEFDSGESVHYLRSSTIDPDVWGKRASFGNSALLSVPVSPDRIHALIIRVEAVLQNPANMTLPRIHTVEDESTQEKLDHEFRET